MFNPFTCMSCYMNEGCEILLYSSGRDCEGIDQYGYTINETTKYFWGKTGSSYLGLNQKIDETHENTRELFLMPTKALEYGMKISIDGIIYDIVDVFPIKAKNQYLYTKLSVRSGR